MLAEFLVGQQPPAAQLAAQGSVLFNQIDHDLPFPTSEPAGQDRQQQLEGGSIDHEPELISRPRVWKAPEERRLRNGTLRAAISANSRRVKSASGGSGAASPVSSARYDDNHERVRLRGPAASSAGSGRHSLRRRQIDCAGDGIERHRIRAVGCLHGLHN